MTINMDELIRCISMALDAVESDFLGASTNHGPRIATLCIAMGRHLGMAPEELTAVASCAMLHDNALTEYILSERPGSAQEFNMRMHCELGQQNVQALPFLSDVEGFVLYHHERADGKGPFRKLAGEFPLGAALIAISDMLDSTLHFQRLDASHLPEIVARVREGRGTQFTEEAADAFLSVLSEELLLSLRDDRIHYTIAFEMPKWTVDIEDDAIVKLAELTARVIDYKSVYTRKHSIQVANMAWLMAEYYGYDRQETAKLYLSASFHDLGKLYIPTEVLEKQGRLSEDEFITIKSHVWWTRELLFAVTGLEDIGHWAANHHEKLDGSGYPEGLTGDQLDFNSRLMACIDIYQAVSDLRPYHPPRSHEETIDMMREMAEKGQIDPQIVEDLGVVMVNYACGQVPSPPGAFV